MFKLDDNLLRELGLGELPADEKNRMLAHIYETLEMRVGMKLAEQMTNEQLDEFEGFIDRSDEAGALKWLETNFPNYKQVVADELEALKAEIKASAAQIVAASRAANPGAQSGPAQPYTPPSGFQQAPPQPGGYQPPAGPAPYPDQSAGMNQAQSTPPAGPSPFPPADQPPLSQPGMAPPANPPADPGPSQPPDQNQQNQSAA